VIQNAPLWPDISENITKPNGYINGEKNTTL
jgi:hypothetical protein